MASLPEDSATAATTNRQRTDFGAGQLAQLIARGDVSSVEVVEAHIARIEEVNPQINALCVPLFDRARAEAAQADLARRRGEALGPLHGVPITVKESFHIAGTPSTMGLTTRRRQLESHDGPLVAKLRAAGAVVLGKTNVPQLKILHESDNPLYGRTNNPWDLQRTPGGSSGGEGAIIAARGSPLGLASDLGGSIRLPAHFCGIQGLKPTSFRLTKQGGVENFRGLETLHFQAGPLARSVEDLELALQVLCDPQVGAASFDYLVPPVPWSESREIDVSTLRIAMWDDDGYVRPAPAIRRVIHEAADALRAAGAEVEPYAPPDAAEGMALYFGLLGADGAADSRRLVQDSELDDRVASILRLGGAPRLLRPLLAWLLRMQGKKELAKLVVAAGPRTADGNWQLTYAAQKYIRRFYQRLDQGRFDAVICPPHALPAFLHNQGKADLMPSASYAFVLNLIGLPCGVVAAGFVGAEEESDRPLASPLARACHQAEVGSAGLPVGVQVAARHWREDIVLAVMGVMEDRFSAHYIRPIV